MDAQVVGILGALAGVAVGGALNWARDAWQGKRDDVRRYHADRRQIYGQLLLAADAHSRSGHWLAQAHGTRQPGTEPRAELDDYGHTRQQLDDLRCAAELVATPPVQMSLKKLADAVESLFVVYLRLYDRHQPPDVIDQLTTGVDGYTEAVEAFKRAARKELGVSDEPASRPLRSRTATP